MLKFNTFYRHITDLGLFSGCHRMPTRSFYYKTYQFPVCARCTGVFLGNIIAIPLYFTIPLHPFWYILGCGIMFLDWFIQYMGWRESNNIRRIITGCIAGYALTSLYMMILCFLITWFL